MPDIQPPENIKELPLAIVKNMITLATSGFGVVVALAWNDAIKKVVTDVVNPYLGSNGSIISLFIYAIAVTLLAVFVTMQLSSLQRKFESLQNAVVARTLARNQANTKKKPTTKTKPKSKTTKKNK